MTTKQPKNKRKPVLPTREMVAPRGSVVPLYIEDMVIEISGRGTSCFKRLKFKGCPKINYHTKGFYSGIDLIDMNRDSLIRDLYQLLSPNANQSTYNRFGVITKYLQWMDENELKPIGDDYFHWNLISEYMEFFSVRVQKGECRKGTWSSAKHTIAWLLKQKGRNKEASKLPSIKGIKKSIKNYQAYNLEAEFKPLIKRLLKAYIALKKHYSEETLPSIHPLWDENLFNEVVKKEGLSNRGKGYRWGSFKNIFDKSHPTNQIVRVAMVLCYAFTGMNATPLARMRIGDVKFKQIKGGTYIFEATKARAKYLEIDNALGFGKYAKSFIEGWLKISLELSKGNENSYLFPRYTKGGECNESESYAETGNTPYRGINKLLGYLGLPSILPSRLRKSKLDILMRATESLYIVSISGNNSIETVSSSYSSGVQSDHENNLGASMEAKFNIAKGEDIKEAILDAKFNFSDILEDYEYQRLREGKNRNHESRTPTGVRCNDNTKGAAIYIDKALKRAGIEVTNDEVICTDFLDCFECTEHALVSDIDDIWLMLSFKDTLAQLLQFPSLNSFPEGRYMKIRNTIDDILDRFKDNSPSNYNDAVEKHKVASHPLYSNAYSLNDMLEVFV
jgi:hypothetical protein